MANYLQSRRSNSQAIPVVILEDNIIENNERFKAILTAENGVNIQTGFNTTIVTIQDNDAATVSFAQSEYTVNETTSSVKLFVLLSGTITKSVTARISTANLDAVGGVDYVTIVNRQITFNPGDPTVQVIPVVILEDYIIENNERFRAILTAENGVNILPGFNTTIVTIQDNDAATLSFAPSEYTVNEATSSVKLFVLINGTITKTVTARISTANLDAVGGVDYVTIVNRQITFSPGDPTVQVIPVVILDDNIIEYNERFKAILTAENGVNIRPGYNTTIVTIQDNDVCHVAAESLQLVVAEGNKDILFVFKAAGMIERDVQVSASTYDISAFAAQNDYVAKSEVVTLQPDRAEVSFFVRVLKDNIVENTEKFGIRVTTSDPQVNIVNGTLLVSITDDDKITLSLERSVYRVKENFKFATIKVVVTGETAVIVTGGVLKTDDETAENPDDYTSISEELVIAPGDQSKTVKIFLKNDRLTEGTENIILDLTTTNKKQISILKSSALLLIQDDDGKVSDFVKF
ncbi:FRAS1-related extracellular matrix protein 3-like [Dendronephthya gigantea]|uniref:FRAS1-related extracellular matrix protein 3-like n=1 Tax=Dendronephthya gigantea TaxID=151771 RepID=UPI00106D9EAF|nr:FRAS1-related extracellular matrix protein 3-like [Dendronephthya gigantea]